MALQKIGSAALPALLQGMGSEPPHVRKECGRLQNQWGLGEDHSTPATSIKQEDLWAAMLSGGKAARVIASVRDTVAVPEEIYSYADGKSKIDEDETKKFARWLERLKN